MTKYRAGRPRVAKRVDDHVGEKIRERRTMLGLTQEHLAATLDISYQQVQKYETGANRVSAGRLYEISRALQTDVAFFFDGTIAVAESGPMPHGGRNRSTIEIARNFGEITDPAIRTALAGLIKSLVAPGDEAEKVDGDAVD